MYICFRQHIEFHYIKPVENVDKLLSARMLKLCVGGLKLSLLLNCILSAVYLRIPFKINKRTVKIKALLNILL